MIVSGFPHITRINDIMLQLGEGHCGSVSVCTIYDFFKLDYDPHHIKQLSRDGKATKDYPCDGASIIGVALAAASDAKIQVDIYSAFGSDTDILESELEDFEKPILDEIKKKDNISFKEKVGLNEILEKISNEAIPILTFLRDGDSSKGHASPLIGANGGEYLLFPVEDKDGKISPKKILLFRLGG